MKSKKSHLSVSLLVYYWIMPHFHKLKGCIHHKYLKVNRRNVSILWCQFTFFTGTWKLGYFILDQIILLTTLFIICLVLAIVSCDIYYLENAFISLICVMLFYEGFFFCLRLHSLCQAKSKNDWILYHSDRKVMGLYLSL